jgi:class 3 adenylate cyclase
MASIPETRYANCRGVYYAYQVFGDGPTDLVFVPDAIPVDLMWEEPRLVRFLYRLGAFARVICFDPRGTGASDPTSIDDLPLLQDWSDDIGRVMDAIGCEQAAVLGHGASGIAPIYFAAAHPSRTSALITVNTFAKWARSDDYPAGMPGPAMEAFFAAEETLWGTGHNVDMLAPSLAGDERFRRWFGLKERLAGSPRLAVAWWRFLRDVDLRSVLPAIRTPALVVQSAGSRWVRSGHGKYLAEHIPNARYVELPTDNHLLYLDTDDRFVGEIEMFLTGVAPAAPADRVLATVLFTDIAGSTARAVELGDRAWKHLLDVHDAVIRRELDRYDGREIKSTGDGMLATFDGPARAIRCAIAVRDAVRSLGIDIRSGLHAGEVELRGDDVGGVAVHIAARVNAAAQPGEVLVSRTVKDLVAGSELRFVDRGAHTLKGIPEEWQLFAVE